MFYAVWDEENGGFRPLLVSRGIVDEKALRTFIRRSFRPLLVSRGIVER